MCDDEYDITSQLIPFDEEKAAKSERIVELIKYLRITSIIENDVDSFKDLFMEYDHEELCIALSRWLVERRESIQRFKMTPDERKINRPKQIKP